MTATSKPEPGSRTAVFDVVVRSVAQGRHRMARLYLLWLGHRVSLDEMAEVVNAATAMRATPAGLSPAQVIQTSRSVWLPDWLVPHIHHEVGRIFAGQPVAGTTPVQLVARIAAAMCIDVSVETSDAAHRATVPDLSQGDGSRPEGDAGAAAAPHHSLIHLGMPDTIDLDQPEHASHDPVLPPPPR